MSCQTEQSFLDLCDQSTCILILGLDFETQDTVLTLDMNINIDKFENSYWGRPCDEGYCYKICRF